MVNHLFRLGPWLPWRVNVITRLGIHGLWNSSGIYPDPQRSGVGIFSGMDRNWAVGWNKSLYRSIENSWLVKKGRNPVLGWFESPIFRVYSIIPELINPARGRFGSHSFETHLVMVPLVMLEFLKPHWPVDIPPDISLPDPTLISVTCCRIPSKWMETIISNPILQHI